MSQTLLQVRQQFRFRGSNVLCLVEAGLCDSYQHITELKEDGLLGLYRLDNELARQVGVVETSLKSLKAAWQPVAFVVAEHSIEIAVTGPVQKKLIIELVEAQFGFSFVKFDEVNLCSIYNNRSEAKI